jgi:hypothetical protein
MKLQNVNETFLCVEDRTINMATLRTFCSKFESELAGGCTEMDL